MRETKLKSYRSEAKFEADRGLMAAQGCHVRSWRIGGVESSRSGADERDHGPVAIEDPWMQSMRADMHGAPTWRVTTVVPFAVAFTNVIALPFVLLFGLVARFWPRSDVHVLYERRETRA